MAHATELNENPRPAAPLPHPLHNDAIHKSSDNIAGSPGQSMRTAAEIVDSKLPEGMVRSTRPDPREILARLLEFTLEYELDCRGLCWMPAAFRVFATKSSDSSFATGTKLFQCDCSLPSTLDSTFIDQLSITFPYLRNKVEAPPVFLKMKSGVYSKDWCATNDKVDVYATNEGREETHLGFVLRQVGWCGYEWQIRSPSDELKYRIVSRKMCAMSCSEMTLEIRGQAENSPEEVISKV